MAGIVNNTMTDVKIDKEFRKILEQIALNETMFCAADIHVFDKLVSYSNM